MAYDATNQHDSFSKSVSEEMAFWDNKCNDYLQKYDIHFISHVRHMIFKYCSNKRPDLCILELGCGSQSMFIEGDAKRIVGLDISRNQLSRYPHEKAFGDMTIFDFKDSFNIILFPASLHHCPKEYKKAIRNAWLHLDESGILCFFEPNLFHPHRIALRLGFLKTISPGEAPLNPIILDRFMKKEMKAKKLHFEYCSIYPPSASFAMSIQRSLIEVTSTLDLFRHLTPPWFFGIYLKSGR